MRELRLFAPVLTVFLMACGPTSQDPVGEIPGPGTDGGGTTADAGFYADAGNCGAQQEEIELINLGDPPDMLIVLDRSGSMSVAPGLFPFPGAATKWSIMEDALVDLTATRGDNINFGLSVFPTDNACGVAPGTAVDIAPSNGGPIAAWLDDHGPDGNTPAHQGLGEALATFSSIPENPEGRFVLFATDGVPNCNPTVDDDGGDETVAAVEALHAAGIETFVLGFGNDSFLDTSVLNDSAQAGGRAKASKPYYYQADDAEELSEAFNEIAGGIITPSCSYELTETPPDPNLVLVTADGAPVPRTPSHSDGWDYHPDESTITFFGETCANIESGAIGGVSFVFGCPGPIAE